MIDMCKPCLLYMCSLRYTLLPRQDTNSVHGLGQLLLLEMHAEAEKNDKYSGVSAKCHRLETWRPLQDTASLCNNIPSSVEDGMY